MPKKKMQEKPFGFETRDDFCNTLISYLMTYLVQDKSFVAALCSLGKEYPTVVKQSLSEVVHIKSERLNYVQSEQMCNEATEYYESLLKLVTDYGLNPAWAMELVHLGVSNLNVLCAGADLATVQEVKQYNITWDIESFPTKNQARRSVLDQFEKQWAECESELKKAGFVRTRERLSQGKHMRWVFKRVCQRKSWNQIAKEEHHNADAISKSVRPLIAKLGLEPPKLIGGRPRK